MSKAPKKTREQERIDGLRQAVRLLHGSFNADTLFSFAVLSRAVMAQGDGLSFQQVKETIDDEFANDFH